METQEIKLTSGVKRPVGRRGRGGRIGSSYPFAQMAVGQQFKIVFTSADADAQDNKKRAVRAATLQWANAHEPQHFETWTVTEELGAKEVPAGPGIWVERLPDLDGTGLQERNSKRAKMRETRQSKKVD
jgi:hypothetical protein